MGELLLDRAGRRRSPATMPGFHAGRPPGNIGLRFPADPPRVEEIIAVMCAAGDDVHGRRLRALIVILWRAGLRVQEALALAEADLDQRRGALLLRRGKGGRRRELGIRAWGWDELQAWLDTRRELPVGPLLCVINGPTRGRHWSSAAARADLGTTAVRTGVRRRFAPTSCATRTPSSSRAKACRGSSSNANSATAVSASCRSTCKASTTPKSSKGSAPADSPMIAVSTSLRR
jgi:integrase